ncbi:MAG: tetratricopeptide repeat protein [Bacteroidales bacterium]
MRLFNFLYIQVIVLFIFLLLIPENLNSNNNSNRDTFQNAKNIELINKKIEILRKNIGNTTDSIKDIIIQNIDLSLSERYDFGLAWNYFLLGRFHQIKQENDSAIFYYKKAWPLTKSNIELELASAVSTGLANIYWETGNYSSGLEFSLEAEQFFEKHNAMDNKFALLNLIALIHESLFEYETALTYFNKAQKIAGETGREDFVGIIFSNMGRLHYKQKRYSKALASLRKGVRLEEKHHHYVGAGRSHTMLANIFLELNECDSAFKYLKKAQNHNINANDMVGLARTHLAYGEYYYIQNQFSTSVESLFKAVDLAKKLNLSNELIKSYHLLAKNYEQTGNFKQSITNYKKYFELYQEVYNVEKINRLNSLEHKLRLQTKENEINRLKIKEEEQTIKYLNIIMVAGILFSLLLLIFIIYYRKNNKLLKQKNREINNQKANLEELNKKLILAETDAGKADEIKTRFLNNLSHEIRTPLNGIVGFSSLIAESKLSDEKKPEIWNMIRKNSEDLIGTIEGLLDLSMAASDSIEIKNTEFNIYDYLYQIHFEIINRYKTQLKKIDFNYIADSKLKDQLINTDKELLKKIIMLVIDNAFKFTRKGSVELGIKKDNGTLQIFASDTGIGILEEKPGEIFSQFVKGKNLPNNSEGLGIGLTIAKQFVELLGGKIWYETEINRSSTFYISLPLNQDQ